MIATIGNSMTGVPAGRYPAPAAERSGRGGDFLSLAPKPDGPVDATPPTGGTSPADRVADGSAKLRDALAAFRKEATLTPAERARRDVLEKMDLTEEAIEAMSPEQRKATEDKIAAEVARRLRITEGAPGLLR